MLDIAVVQVARSENGLGEHQGCAARSVFLEAMVHFRYFRVVGERENVGGLLG